MLNRAYSIVDLKSVDDEQRVIRGMASTPSVDRMGDIVEPLGARAASDIPLFLYHDSNQTVGRTRLGKPTKAGIPFEASIPHVKEAGRLKDRVDEAWQMLKYRLITGVSIGFRPMADGVERMKDGGMRFKDFEILELSLVPVPAQAEATITSIKSLDNAARAASGHQRSVATSPGASGTATTGHSTNRSPKGKDIMQTLKDLRDERETKAARMGELNELKRAEGRKFTDEERGEFDSLADEIESLDDDIKVKQYHETNAATAVPVTQQRRGMSFVRKADPDDKFKGQAYTRGVIAKIAAKLYGSTPSAIAEHRWGKTHPQLVSWIKANEVAGGGSGSGEWGAELVSFDGRYTGDFIEFLYGRTVFDKLALREVPANVTIKGQDGEATGYWVGESKAIPNTPGDFSTVNLSPLKVGALSVVSNDLIRYSTPAAEQLVANMLSEASAKRIDQTVFSATAASAGVSPAGLLNGLSALVTTGTDQAAVLSLINTLYAPFISAKNSSGLTFVMNPSQAKAISLLVTSLGNPAFPSITGNGGTLMGDPVVVGDNIDSSQVILLKATDIYKIGDTGVEVSVSQEASIEQRSDPSGATDTPTGVNVTGFTNMFQEDSTAIKIVRHINFAKRRSTAVAYTDTADFQGVAS
jgi:phage head maturation protease